MVHVLRNRSIAENFRVTRRLVFEKFMLRDLFRSLGLSASHLTFSRKHGEVRLVVSCLISLQYISEVLGAVLSRYERRGTMEECGNESL